MEASKEERQKVSKIVIYKLQKDFPKNEVLKWYRTPENGKGKLEQWDYEIFTKTKKNVPPAWKPLINEFVNQKEIPRNSYSSLVILFKKDKYYYALTAGYGYVDIRDYAVTDFGIYIACKSLDPDKLDHLYQKVPTGNVYGLFRQLRGKYLPSDDKINQRSVLKALKGKIINQELGVSMEGRTSLVITGGKNFSDLIKALNTITALEETDETTVDIKGLEETSEHLKNELDQVLIEKIINGEFDNMLFGYENEILSDCDILKVGRNRTPYLVDEIDKVIEEALRQKPQAPSSVKVRGYDNQQQKLFDRKLIDLIEGELDYNENKYFRIHKKWYKINQDYKNEMESEFKVIEVMSSNYFTSWRKENGTYVSEDDFIKMNCGDNKIIAHKHKILHVELADIIDKENKYLIHVKKGKGAFLRNLFSQGYVSARLLHSHQKFIEGAREKFSLDENDKFKIIFAIFPEGERRIDSIFTLFAKVDLLERNSALKEMGYDVCYCIIQ